MVTQDFSYYFSKHLTDKHINGYTPAYNDYCAPRKNDNISLLEIGIGTLHPTKSCMISHQYWTYKEYKPGASLRAFKEFFPNGKIYGIDTQSDCMVEEDRIKTFMFDSRIPEMCDEHLKDMKFDFIIDDGDHTYTSQIKTFENMFSRLTQNGVYILEDLESPNELREYFETTPYQFTFRNRLIVITAK